MSLQVLDSNGGHLNQHCQLVGRDPEKGRKIGFYWVKPLWAVSLFKQHGFVYAHGFREKTFGICFAKHTIQVTRLMVMMGLGMLNNCTIFLFLWN